MIGKLETLPAKKLNKRQAGQTERKPQEHIIIKVLKTSDRESKGKS